MWSRFGDTRNYVEPFAGSLAVLLARETEPKIETVNDLDCVAPDSRMLKADLSWYRAGEVRVGDELLGFDESNGEARQGLRAPKRYRRLAKSRVLAVRNIKKPCYRLTFDDGTSIVCSADHMWLGGSHKSGGRGWRWVKTENMVCNRVTQRSWVLKVADVVEREDTHDAGWIGGILDGEGSIKAGPGSMVSLTQNEGPILDRAESLLTARGIKWARRKSRKRIRRVEIKGGMAEQLSVLMRFRPERLIRKLGDRLPHMSLYGREHRAVGLVAKEFLGEQWVVAIQTDTKTFIAEGLASHNCWIANFWRALHADPESVAHYADWPVNEADLHARHLWLVKQTDFRERMKTDPDHFDAKIAGWWVWGISQWIGSGWCSGMGVHVNRKRPRLGNDHGRGVLNADVPNQIPDLSGDSGAAGRTIFASAFQRDLGTNGLYEWMHALSARLRRVRVCCGDWKRILGPAPTTCIGTTAVFLDPPYAVDDRADVYGEESREAAHEVREWAIANGDNPQLRIALCGYDTEHKMPDSWTEIAWKANGGFANQKAERTRGKENAHRERIWFSPHCLNQPGLFEAPESE